jgi:hypothetical protein
MIFDTHQFYGSLISLASDEPSNDQKMSKASRGASGAAWSALLGVESTTPFSEYLPKIGKL